MAGLSRASAVSWREKRASHRHTYPNLKKKPPGKTGRCSLKLGHLGLRTAEEVEENVKRLKVQLATHLDNVEVFAPYLKVGGP